MFTLAPSRIAALRRLVPLLLLAIAGALFIRLGGSRYLTLSALADNRELLLARVAHAGPVGPLCFIVTYAGLTAMSVPGAVLLSVAAGALFGIWAGTLYAVTGATIGATALFAAARAGFGHIADRAGPWAARLEGGFRANAFSYLLVLRLVPLFPFWLVNLAAALTRISLRTYVAATFLGIIPGCFVFVSIGGAIDKIVAAGRAPNLNVIFKPSVLLPIFGLAVLALLPVAYKHYRTTKVLVGDS